MAYKILYSSIAERDFRKFDLKTSIRIIKKIAEMLSVNPYGYPLLKGVEGELRRFRVGSYRVIYQILENPEQAVIVEYVRHRKDVYRRVK